MPPFHVYLLKCADGSYYVGHTDELQRRVAQHEAGELPGYTLERRPVSLVWQQETATREEALAAELRIKGWSRAKKEALIAGDWEGLKQLARASTGSARTEVGASTGSARTEAGAARTEGGVAVTKGGDARAEEESVRAEPVEAPAPRATVRAEPVEALARTLLGPAGPAQRRALAKAITRLESTHPQHRAEADALLNLLLPHAGRSLRIGLSGVPGVGKSTFIEALGLHLVSQGHRVAVLTVDPSSSVGGGSILGDKTRMERLSVHERAFIRPSPSSGTLGGVAEKTREALLACEAAGHDIVIVETVGVGQSETTVAGMTDCFVLLQLPNAGDDLQAIKKGVMELADLVVINKTDLDEAAATRARAQITSALRYLGPHAHAGTEVLQLSALKSAGIEAFWAAVQRFATRQREAGRFDERRTRQNEAWMW
ncbi:MAG: methylmalonyl Co-A mutase-associated GTPase MeaB, partial [Pseudomonadota bacterium]